MTPPITSTEDPIILSHNPSPIMQPTSKATAPTMRNILLPNLAARPLLRMQAGVIPANAHNPMFTMSTVASSAEFNAPSFPQCQPTTYASNCAGATNTRRQSTHSGKANPNGTDRWWFSTHCPKSVSHVAVEIPTTIPVTRSLAIRLIVLTSSVGGSGLSALIQGSGAASPLPLATGKGAGNRSGSIWTSRDGRASLSSARRGEAWRVQDVSPRRGPAR